MVEVVAALVHDTENPRRFLICQRPAHKARGLLWEFVGGKVEPGETKREALVRECREELGVAVSVGDVYMELTHVYPDLTIHLTLFHAEITDGVPQLLEHCAMDWITPEEIGGLLDLAAELKKLHAMLLPVLIALVPVTFLVMATAGRVTQRFAKAEPELEEELANDDAQ